MSKKKERPIAAKKSGGDLTTEGSKKYFLPLFIVVLVSFISLLPVLNNGILNWDDMDYLQNNPLIFSFDFKEIFSKYVWGNYHPLTILVYAIEYHLFGMSAKGFHAVNLLLHLSNVVLVFYVVSLLSGKTEIATVASLLFGIHPMHVESVAWIAELKDLLYTFFFLGSYIFYLRYLKHQQRKFYVYALLFFILSLFSKAMAASLPVVLLLTDYFKGRKLNGKVWLEKLPFFVLSIIFGIIAVLAQKSSGAISEISIYPFYQRIIFACYGFITYLVKLAVPFQLSAYYPYPIGVGTDLPAIQYFYFFLFIGLVVYAFYSLRKTRKIFFGIGFFAITIFLVLQLLPVGNAVMADRYSYIPSIGIFYLIGEGIYWLWSKKGKFAAIAVIALPAIFYAATTYARCAIWKNDMALWDDVISNYQTVPIAYNNRGNLRMNENDFEGAMSDYSKAIELQPGFPDAWLNRGTLLMRAKKYDESLRDFDKAIELKPDFARAYNNRGNALSDANKPAEALRDFSKAIELQPDYTQAYYSRGNFFMKQTKYDEALKDYNRALELQPDFFEIYNNRGLLFMREKKYREALRDYNSALDLRPESPEAHYSRALVHYYLSDKSSACKDLQIAIDRGYRPADEMFAKICY